MEHSGHRHWRSLLGSAAHIWHLAPILQVEEEGQSGGGKGLAAKHLANVSSFLPHISALGSTPSQTVVVGVAYLLTCSLPIPDS